MNPSQKSPLECALALADSRHHESLHVHHEMQTAHKAMEAHAVRGETTIDAALRIITEEYRKREGLVRMNALLQVQLTAALEPLSAEDRAKIEEIAA